MRRILKFSLVLSLAFGLMIAASPPALAHNPCESSPFCRPHISVVSGSVLEGNSGMTTITFTISRSGGNFCCSVPVTWSTANGTATDVDSPTTGPADYQPTSGGADLTVASPSVSVSVNVVGDTWDEANEFFFLDVTSSSLFSHPFVRGTGTILNDDPPAPLILVVSSGSVLEGNSGMTTITFTISRSGGNFLSVPVTWSTANGTATDVDSPTTGPADYQPTSGGADLTVASPSVSVSVNVVGDTWDEANEFFFLDVTSSSLFEQGTGTILSDDPPAPAGLDHDVGIAGGGFRTKGHIDLSRNGAGPFDVVIKVKNYGDWAEDTAYQVTSNELGVVFSPQCTGFISDFAPSAVMSVAGCTVTYNNGDADPDPELTLTVYHNAGDGGIDSDTTNNADTDSIVLNP